MGASQSPDLAVVQIEGEGTFPVARFSDRVQAGERVAVLGYPLTFALGLDAGAFVGVVSKQTAGVDGRYLQVDVSVNPGMSGAPLLNADGDMVGLITSRVEVVNGRNVLDVALAIPSSALTVALPGLTTGYREQSVASVAAPAAPVPGAPVAPAAPGAAMPGAAAPGGTTPVARMRPGETPQTLTQANEIRTNASNMAAQVPIQTFNNNQIIKLADDVATGRGANFVGALSGG